MFINACTLLKFAISQEKIPIKWMAPEQFDKTRGQKRVYTQATDVWSYGVVCQEIFSKGKCEKCNIHLST